MYLQSECKKLVDPGWLHEKPADLNLQYGQIMVNPSSAEPGLIK